MGQARKRFSSSNFTLRQHSHLPASASDEERSAPGPPSRRRSALRRLHPLRRRARCGRAQRETLLGRGAPSRCRCSAALAPSRRRTSSMTCGAPHTTRRLRFGIKVAEALGRTGFQCSATPTRTTFFGVHGAPAAQRAGRRGARADAEGGAALGAKEGGAADGAAVQEVGSHCQPVPRREWHPQDVVAHQAQSCGICRDLF